MGVRPRACGEAFIGFENPVLELFGFGIFGVARVVVVTAGVFGAHRTWVSRYWKYLVIVFAFTASAGAAMYRRSRPHPRVL